MKGFGDAKPRKNSVRIEDLVPVLKWPEGEYETIRLIGPITAYANVWFTISTQRKPEGVSIPKLCLDLDPETDEFTTDVCPYRASSSGRLNKFYVVNAIVRSIQEDEDGNPRKFPKGKEITTRHDYKAYWGTKNDVKRTPVRVVVFTENAAERLANLKKLNKVRGNDGVVTYEMSDPQFGCDIDIMIDPEKKGAARVDIQKGDRTPISKSERAYIIFPIDLLKPDSLAQAKKEVADLEDKIVAKDKDGNRKKRRDDDDDDRSTKRNSKSRRDDDDDDITDISEDDLEDDIEMEDRPRRGGKSRDDKRSSKRSSRDEEEDDLESELDEDFEDADEKPRSKRRSRDDDEDEEDRGSRKRSRSRDEDEEDDRSSRRRSSRDDDDLDSEFDEDSDEDEEDDRSSRRRRR